MSFDGQDAYTILLEAFEHTVEAKVRLEQSLNMERQRADDAERNAKALRRENESLAKMERFVEREDIAPLYNAFLTPHPQPGPLPPPAPKPDDEPF